MPEELVPFLEQALVSFPGPWLFTDETGAMRNVTWQPEDVLRRALKRAGIVTGYQHKCRRKGCGHEEPHADPRRCPRCDFLLWPKAQVRAIRFHDLRHTYASVLLMLGANVVSVQNLLGHSDPKITERRCGHLLLAKRRGRNPFGFPRDSGLMCGGEYGTRTRGLRRDRPAL